MRRVMLERLTRPLKGAWWVGVCVFLFLAAVVTGFVLCMNFTSASEAKLAVEFAATRDARRNVLNIVEGMRQMLYGNLLQNRDEFDQGRTQLADRHAELVKDLLPIINPIDAIYHERLPHIKLFHRINVNATRVDFIPATVTPVELANTIAQTGSLVLGLSEFGVLSSQHFANISSLRFIVDNFFEIYDGMRLLPSIGLQVHAEMAQQVTIMISVIMAVSLALLGILGVVVFLAIFRQYFRQESKVHGLMMAFPKRTAANLLVDIEEELESFREITQNEELDETDLGATTADTSNNDGDDSVPTGSSVENATGGQSSRSGIPSKRRRVTKYYIWLALAFTGICTCVLALFSYTLSALFAVDGDTNLLVKSADRRYFLNGIVFAAREFASPDWSIPSAKILQNPRSPA
ncbi:hypothetical protein BCR44DRAFT_361787 [Catenaria anguillulae PL171]|uniref:Uncharacterized protein n=1 Tax=Catenaria anguillulae PL171 TaxID=765915 RepID=A0A1Y2HHU7_9FUNG|nr:hypothetical protein BCR44DRAFT_361787 [Catenaria anguillulae PL171]